MSMMLSLFAVWPFWTQVSPAATETPVTVSVPAPTVEGIAQYAAARVVKITGAAVGSQKGYGSGVLVSADGLIVTALTPLIEASDLRVVTHDGQKFSASIVSRDSYRQLAVLRIPASDLPHFSLADPTGVEPGTWVIAASNVFKVAQGNEPVSITLGTFGGYAKMAARYRRQDIPYRGRVVITDVIVSAPGSAGGAIVDLHENLIGVIGRPAISLRTNTWLNYALPVDEVRDLVLNGPRPDEQDVARDEQATISKGQTLAYGFRLWDVGGSVRPAYVERVVADSRASIAGLRTDDLILEIDQQPIAECADAYRVLATTDQQKAFEIVVKRGMRIESIVMEPARGVEQ
ncbi:MAG: S1C family serine protease [Phycisphaerae bacterium]